MPKALISPKSADLSLKAKNFFPIAVLKFRPLETNRSWNDNKIEGLLD